MYEVACERLLPIGEMARLLPDDRPHSIATALALGATFVAGTDYPQLRLVLSYANVPECHLKPSLAVFVFDDRTIE
jgi:hypothetical protein